jgi:hypothetical protein
MLEVAKSAILSATDHLVKEESESDKPLPFSFLSYPRITDSRSRLLWISFLQEMVKHGTAFPQYISIAIFFH